MKQSKFKGENAGLIVLFILAANLFIPIQAERARTGAEYRTIDVDTTLDTPDLPIHIHLTWQNDTSTTITVTWQTNSSISGDIVLYDIVSRFGIPGEYRYNVTGINYTYSGASGYIHDVELTGLTPNTTYYFICGGPSGGYSEERCFRTAPQASSYVRFVMGGDSQSEVKEKISVAMAKTNPSFVLHAGDLVNYGTIQWWWDDWFTDVDSNWIGENNLTIPIIPTLGNHENPESADCKYFPQFALPGNEKWYSLDWGPDIHIIVLDGSNMLYDALGPQRDWLENDLATHSDYIWKFVVFHRPAFVSAGYEAWKPAFDNWVPLFDKYHVNIVFNGHLHGYQRTYPVNWSASQTEAQDYSNGTMYITSGGWGGFLFNAESFWFMAYQNMTYNFCVIDVFMNNTLHLQAKDILGNTFDEVTIQKSRLGDLRLVIKDSSGAVVAGASVTSTSQPGGQSAFSGMSTADGSVTFTGLAVGNYTLQISKSSYVSSTAKGTVKAGSKTELNATLQAQPSDGIPGFPLVSIVVGVFLGSAFIWLYSRRPRLRGV